MAKQFLLIFAFSLAFIGPTCAAPYKVAFFPTTAYTNLAALNDRGEAVFYLAHRVEPVHTDPLDGFYKFDGNSLTRVTGTGATIGSVEGINDIGTMVGSAYGPEDIGDRGDIHAHAFVKQGTSVELINSPPLNESSAGAINEQGQVVGYFNTYPGAHPFLWDPATGTTDLGTFGGESAVAMDINDRSDVLIKSLYRVNNLKDGDYIYGSCESLIVSDGGVKYIGGINPLTTSARAINNARQVVGDFLAIPGQEAHAFIWDEVNGMKDLGRPGENSFAIDVNDQGTVLGYVGYPFATDSFIYDNEHGRRSLKSLLPKDAPGGNYDVLAINNRGQILGGHAWGEYFLMTPVPEPTTFQLALAVALVSVFAKAFAHRRGNRTL